MTSSTSQTVLLFGSTGATGKLVLRELLSSDHFTKVVEAGRRVTASEALSDVAGKEKLIQKTIDFEDLDAAKLKDEKADVVVIVVSPYAQLVTMANLSQRMNSLEPHGRQQAVKKPSQESTDNMLSMPLKQRKRTPSKGLFTSLHKQQTRSRSFCILGKLQSQKHPNRRC